MAYVQVKLLQALKIAAIAVAFFSSFIYAIDASTLDLSGLDFEEAQKETKIVIQCKSGYTDIGTVEVADGEYSQEVILTMCHSVMEHWSKGEKLPYDCPETGTEWTTPSYYKRYFQSNSYCNGTTTNASYTLNAGIIDTVVRESCPNFPYDFAYQLVIGNPLVCFKTTDVLLLVEADQNKKNDKEKCEGLILDSGNNSADSLCYSDSVSGRSCNVSKVSVGDGAYTGAYYKGVSSADGGCFTSENPPYDDTGTGDEKDGCIYSNGTNYCEANRAKHCQSTMGTEICDDGCIDDGVLLFCDISRHPDVGEGESDFFDDNGTCSVVSASSSKGYCEDMGGEWDETQDYEETSCPSGGGACSVATAGFCQACFDAGGTWTPDDTAILSEETQAGLEIAALVKKSNEKLAQVEHGQRKTMESMQSTMKSGNEKVVNAIEALGDKLEDKEEEKESYTTTTEAPDKTAFTEMFGASAQAEVKERVITAQVELDNILKSILAESKAIFTINVPAAVGYQVRNIQLSYGAVDASLSRYSDFFKALAGPIMLLCSLIAALALLRD